MTEIEKKKIKKIWLRYCQFKNKPYLCIAIGKKQSLRAKQNNKLVP